jgi:hypothetical protein
MFRVCLMVNSTACLRTQVGQFSWIIGAIPLHVSCRCPLSMYLRVATKLCSVRMRARRLLASCLHFCPHRRCLPSAHKHDSRVFSADWLHFRRYAEVAAALSPPKVADHDSPSSLFFVAAALACFTLSAPTFSTAGANTLHITSN